MHLKPYSSTIYDIKSEPLKIASRGLFHYRNLAKTYCITSFLIPDTTGLAALISALYVFFLLYTSELGSLDCFKT